MKRIEFYWWRLREEFCKRHHINHIFKTNVGVKGITGISQPRTTPISNETFILESNELYLGVDYLKDRYTLLGCNLLDSPHYNFLRAIRDNEDLLKTDYLIRFEKGTLDGRRGMPKQKKINKYIEKYKIRQSELERNQLAPVLVYKIAGSYYIYDGKHRAALCALNDKPVVCQQVNVNLFVGKYDLIKQDREYQKHHELYQKFE